MAVEGVESGFHAGVSHSPTVTSPAMTAAGILLGTAAYMSPEQAKGKPADKRSDIWAFGCVLYEMLAGARPFAGDDVSDVMASVLAKEPDWTRLPSTLPPALGIYIKRCLHKNPKQRIGDVQDVRLALEGAFDTPSFPLAAPGRILGWGRFAALLTAVIGLAAAAGATVWYAIRAPHFEPVQVSRFQDTFSGAAALFVSTDEHSLAITPDGSRLIYVGDGGRQLFVRTLDALEPVSVFTGAPRGPFVSPDGQWIGFTERGAMKKISITGGAAVTVAMLDAPTARGASWGPDDTIIFASTNPATGLQRVGAGGGPTTMLTRADRGQGEADHGWPEWLPGGHAVLFTITALAGGPDATQVAVFNLLTGVRTVLLHGGSHPHYIPSGHLVYSTAGTLRAVLFDADRLELRGTPVAVVRDVVTTESGAADAVISLNGTLVYVPGPAVSQSTRTLVWVDRQRRETAIQAPPRAYVHPRLSPDGTRLAVFVADQELDVWLLDLSRTTFTRFTSGPGVDTYPLWTHDGRRLIFSSQRTGVANLFWQAADRSGDVERLTNSSNAQSATGISPDGRFLIFTEVAPTTGEDVMQMTLDPTRAVTPLVESGFAERNGTVSPNGRWLAYEANDSGRFEVYVRPFPNVNSAIFPVSTDGGTRPLWSPTGQELVYISPAGALMRVGVGPDPAWTSTTPTLVVKEGYYTQPDNAGRTYDMAPDGGRFLMIKGTTGPTPRSSLNFVHNWTEELKRLASAR